MPGRKGNKASGDKAENPAKQNAEIAEEENEENESKAPIEAKVDEKAADGAETSDNSKEPSTKKPGRGRPKKVEGQEPVAKKPKIVRERSKPSRVSQRVSNQKKGIKMPAEDGLKMTPKKKISKKTEKPSKEISESEEEATTTNGAAEQTVES